jgi:sterol 3beta-glucosyltransferase
MKILVPALGSRGDVQPYIALSQGLQREGHSVILATNPTMTSLVETYGVPSAAVGPAVDMGLEGAKLWEKSGNNMWLGLIRVMGLASRLIEQAYPDILALAQDADLVVVSDATAGAAEAAKLGKPWISATLQPERIPSPPPNPNPAQWVMGKTIWPIFGKLMTAPINRFRRRVGAPLVQDVGSMQSECLILLPVSRHVAPPKPGWPAYVKVTGYWNASPLVDWSPPPDLVGFLEAGEKPVCISLGAMALAGEATAEAARMTLEALRQTGVRAVIQGWNEPLVSMSLPENVFHAGSVPHTWLFPRCAAVVHHGGFGTTGSTLTAGIPGLVVPHIIDQFYWAKQTHHLGASPAPIPRARLTSQAMAYGIEQCLTNEPLRVRAAELGEKIRAEPDGVEQAVRWIEAEEG